MRKTNRFLSLIFITFFTSNIYAHCNCTGFADLVEPLLPAVVNISTVQKATSSGSLKRVPGLPEGSPFEDFFNQFFDKYGIAPGMEEEERSDDFKPMSAGSGFVIDASGYIVTNQHVVANAEKITVKLTNDQTYDAKLIGSDPRSDLALLKIEADKPLPFVMFGDSEASRVGDGIIAIGNPFGLGGTVTYGIISANARDINTSSIVDNFIQTDAAINKGNSGGPFFNMKGEVIGISTAIYSPSGGNIGIGFAIPSSFARPIIDQLKKGGKVKRPFLGVTIQPTLDIAESLGIENNKGALVIDVTKGSPADKAGIVVGDILLEFDGKEINNHRKFPRLVAETPADKETSLVILTKGKKKTVNVKLRELDEKTEKSLTKQYFDSENPVEMLEVQGMNLAELIPSLRTKYNVPAQVNGVIVLNVAPKSAAAKSGIKPGDIVVSVNQETIIKPAQASGIIDQLKKENKKSVMLLIKRGKDTFFLRLSLVK